MSTTTAGTFVRGELDLEPLELRWDRAKFRYWQKLENQPKSRTLYQVYEESWKAERFGLSSSYSWCSKMRKLAEKYGIEDKWDGRWVYDRDDWKETTQEMMRDKFCEEWRKGVAEKKELSYYALYKQQPCFNHDLLNRRRERYGLAMKLRFLSSSILFGGGRRIKCECGKGEPTVKHVIAECPCTKHLRVEMRERLVNIVGRRLSSSLLDCFRSIFSLPDCLLSFVFRGRDYPLPGFPPSESVERLVRNFLVCVYANVFLCYVSQTSYTDFPFFYLQIFSFFFFSFFFVLSNPRDFSK